MSAFTDQFFYWLGVTTFSCAALWTLAGIAWKFTDWLIDQTKLAKLFREAMQIMYERRRRDDPDAG